MKISRNLMLLIGFGSLVFADETMCFKKNFTDLETINQVKLDGGLCLGKNSRDDMQKNGWSIKNIEIKNDYYIYIFKKINDVSKIVEVTRNDMILKDSNISKKSIKEEILNELKIEKKREETKVKLRAKIKEEEKGKTLYLNKCATCHGINGEKEAGYSQALNSISLDSFKRAMNGYKIGSYNLGNGSEMRPYSEGITTPDIDAVYKYLKNKK
jgi:cytochrome c553